MKNPDNDNRLSPSEEEAPGADRMDFPGYPPYPPEEDIYVHDKKESKLDPENVISRKEPAEYSEELNADEFATISDTQDLTDTYNADAEEFNEDDFDNDLVNDDSEIPGDQLEDLDDSEFPHGFGDDDLDIPGAELDDEDEMIGREDEENNYYSLGGDNHEDLEQDTDDWVG